MKKKLIFNDTSSEDMGLVIQAPPSYEYPERDVSVAHVPGRNGDIIIDNGCYKNVNRTYVLGKKFDTIKHFTPNAEEVLAWLTSAKGKYARLTDDYDQDVYRLATYRDQGSFVNYFDEALAITITFECKPQRFLLDGEKDVDFVFTDKLTEKYVIEAKIENPSHYESLPLITIENMVQDYDRVTMLSVINSDNEIVSSVTMSDVTDVNIDSENQVCYDNSNNVINDKIGLNGKDFPNLQKDITTLRLEKYSRITKNVPTYQSLLSTSQTKCETEYASQEVLITKTESKHFIKSFESLIDSVKDIYDASSYQMYISENGEKFVFGSYNTLLNTYGQAFIINTNVSDISWPVYTDSDGNQVQWLKGTQSGNDITVKANTDGYFLFGDAKIIQFYEANETLGTCKSNGSTTIKFYPIEKPKEICWENDESFDQISKPSFVELEQIGTGDTYKIKAKYDGWYVTNGNMSSAAYYSKGQNLVSTASRGLVYGTFAYININIYYEDMPYWVDFSVTYEKKNGHLSPTKINYKTNYANGYYWTDKKFIIGKSKWDKYPRVGTVLDSLSWDTGKRAFTNSAILSTSTTASITYQFIPEPLQYSDDEAPVHFTVSISNDINSITLKSIEAGWYSYSYKGGDPTSWVWKTTNTIINPSPFKGTDTFTVYYMAASPTYENEVDWPWWVDPIPYKIGVSDFEQADPNASTIYFKVSDAGTYSADKTYEVGDVVKYQGYYYEAIKQTIGHNPTDEIFWKRLSNTDFWYSYSIGDNEYTDWVQLPKGDPINDAQGHSGQNSGESFFVRQIKEDPSDLNFDNDRSYSINSGTPTDQPPAFLTVTYPSDETTGDDLVQYNAAQAGYYKWDNNVSWIYISSDDISHNNNLLLKTGIKDTTVFYYLSTLPEYTQQEFVYFTVEHVETLNNPTSIDIYANTNGYFRVNSSADWIYYSYGDKIASSTINTENVVYYLSPYTNCDLTSVKITVKPRWWKL